MIVVAGIVKAVDGRGDELEQEFTKLVPKVREEPGNIAFMMHRSVDDPNKFFAYERYTSKDAFKEHSSAPHVREFLQAAASLLDGRPDVGFYREI